MIPACALSASMSTASLAVFSPATISSSPPPGRSALLVKYVITRAGRLRAQAGGAHAGLGLAAWCGDARFRGVKTTRPPRPLPTNPGSFSRSNGAASAGPGAGHTSGPWPDRCCSAGAGSHPAGVLSPGFLTPQASESDLCLHGHPYRFQSDSTVPAKARENVLHFAERLYTRT